MHHQKKEAPLRLIALIPATSGIGFAVMETPQTVIDWGKRCGPTATEELFKTYNPDVLVIEDVTVPGCRKRQARRDHIGFIEALADEMEIAVRPIARYAVLDHFGVDTKVELAKAVSLRVPALAHRVPPYRKAWMTEDQRLPIFEALGFLFAVLRAE